MSSTFEESVLNFDINFLQPTNVNDCRIDKQRKSIQIAKKKTIAIDSLIRKYLHNKEKCEQNEVVLLTAKEECKQVCIDYKDALEKCTQLQNDLQTLKNKNAELDAKCTLSQNQYEGMKSHANQLQLLVKNHESVIEALKVEKHLEKNNSEDSEKNLLSIQKENEVLLRHLRLLKDIALGKKKLRKQHKVLLQKYDNLKSASSEDDSSTESISDEPDICDDSPNSPLFTSPEDSVGDKTEHDVFKPTKIENCVKTGSMRLNEDNDSDCSNEVVSEDTGRGSSLAFSDGEKCFNSPDYFNTDSPITPEAGKIKEQILLMDSGTSPNRNQKVVHIATSPLIFDDEALLNDNYTLFDEPIAKTLEYFITDIPLSDEIVTIKEKRKLVDIGTSPVKNIEIVNVATSPLLFEECDSPNENNILKSVPYSISPVLETNYVKDNCLSYMSNRVPAEKTSLMIIEDTVTGLNGKQTTIDNLTSHCELEISGKLIEERKCLERNNSNTLSDDNSNDGEIEMILNTMRLTQRLITPIPKTPVKVHNLERRKIQESAQKATKHEVCQDALILRQENKVLQANIAYLRKDIMDIKSLIKNHLLICEGSKEQPCNESENSINTEMFDDASQETILIYTNDDSSNFENETGNSFDLPNDLRNEELTPVIETNENEYECVTNIPLENNSFTSDDLAKVSKSPTQASAISASKLQTVTQRDDSSTEMPTELNKPIQKEFGKESESPIASIHKNDIREAITFEEYLESEDDDIIINHNIGNSVKNSSRNINKNRITKHKKLSKLGKFKQKLLPKSRILKIAPVRKLRNKSKLKSVPKKRIDMDPKVILSNKSAYEKAAKVMAEIKSTQKDLVNKGFKKRKVKKMVAAKKDEVNKKKHDSICSELNQELPNGDTNPVVCLIDLKLNTLQTEQHIHEKPIDQKNLNEKNLESIQDEKAEFSSVATRSQSNKHSRNDSVTPSQVDLRENKCDNPKEKRRRLKRSAPDSPNLVCKRVLRSSSIGKAYVDLDHVNDSSSYYGNRKSLRNRNYDIEYHNVFSDDNRKQTNSDKNEVISSMPNKITDCKLSENDNEKLNVSDQKNVSNMPNEARDRKLSKVKSKTRYRSEDVTDDDSDDQPIIQTNHPKQSILCKMIKKHGRTEKSSSKKVPDNVTNSICKKLEDGIALINELPQSKVNESMSKLVDEVQSWNAKHFMSGFMKYLKEPTRKKELFNKVNTPPAPPMTKSEQVLLYIVRQLETQTPNTVNEILINIEYSLFQLNRTPEFDTIESLSHFFALLCRYFGLKSRLRLFLMDAMYCLQFKVVPLIKQCLDVWMHILPLAHMGIAKSPLVTCLVYLLHFYKCEDRFNRVQEIRYILSRKYFYEITDWNETKILEMFKNAIREIRDIPIEKKLLRMALIILGKRQGPKWCQKNIINNMLMPMIDRDDVSMSLKQFCVQTLGALIKPFPADMKVHFEIAVNHLHDLLAQNPPDSMKEAVFTSLIYINNHNPNRVIQSLLTWMPKQVSPEFEKFLRDYVRGKPVNAWKKILSRISM